MKNLLFSLSEALYSLKSLIDPAYEGNPYEASASDEEYIIFKKPSFSLKTAFRKRIIYRV